MFDIRILIFVIFSMLILYAVVYLSLYRVHMKLTKIEKKLDTLTHGNNKSDNTTNVKGSKEDKLK